MESVEHSGITSQTMAQTQTITLSPLTSIPNKMKWTNTCQEHAKNAAEKAFNDMFIEHSMAVPTDLILSKITEQFCQTFKARLKELAETKISDREVRHPSLLKTTSVALCDKGGNDNVEKLAKDNSPGFTLDCGTSNALSLASSTANAANAVTSTGKSPNVYTEMLK